MSRRKLFWMAPRIARTILCSSRHSNAKRTSTLNPEPNDARTASSTPRPPPVEDRKAVRLASKLSPPYGGCGTSGR